VDEKVNAARRAVRGFGADGASELAFYPVRRASETDFFIRHMSYEKIVFTQHDVHWILKGVVMWPLLEVWRAKKVLISCGRKARFGSVFTLKS
jgi:hypothetical protein